MSNLINYVYLLEDSTIILDKPGDLCNNLAPLLRLVGIVLLAIKIVVPIILIVIGMLELAKAVGDQDEVSKATKKLVQKLIIAVLVFLVATIVGLVMSLIGHEEYKDCMTCIRDPFNEKCPRKLDL